MEMVKVDSMTTGAISGMVMPPVFMALFYLVAFAESIPFSQFMDQLADAHRFSVLLSFGLLGNLVPFFLFYRRQMDRAANGVIGATLLLGAIIVYLKFVH
jgi:hypothetical protein